MKPYSNNYCISVWYRSGACVHFCIQSKYLNQTCFFSNPLPHHFTFRTGPSKTGNWLRSDRFKMISPWVWVPPVNTLYIIWYFIPDLPGYSPIAREQGCQFCSSPTAYYVFIIICLLKYFNFPHFSLLDFRIKCFVSSVHHSDSLTNIWQKGFMSNHSLFWTKIIIGQWKKSQRTAAYIRGIIQTWMAASNTWLNYPHWNFHLPGLKASIPTLLLLCFLLPYAMVWCYLHLTEGLNSLFQPRPGTRTNGLRFRISLHWDCELSAG